MKPNYQMQICTRLSLFSAKVTAYIESQFSAFKRVLRISLKTVTLVNSMPEVTRVQTYTYFGEEHHAMELHVRTVCSHSVFFITFGIYLTRMPILYHWHP